MSDLAARAAALLGEPVAGMRRLHGGDLSEVALVRLASGRRAVVKAGPRLRAEAAMLRAIGNAGAPAPEVFAVSGDLLAMEAVEDGGPPDWAALGRAVRTLHDDAEGDYGWPEDHAFGRVSIRNARAADWPAFWAERRLLADAETLPADLVRRLERVAARLPGLLPAWPAPSLLHGDLWAGNALFGPDGAPTLIDPACYRGHAEVDLAMLTLFGSPGPGFAEGYGPVEPGIAERRPIYQLWPALAHLRLFGAGYRGMVEDLLDRIG